MANIELVRDYKHVPELRAALNRRLREIFGFDMERLYTEGYWSGVYVPYSFALAGEIVANVSAIFQDFIVDGEAKKGVVIESVLTAPEFRGRGLAAELMRTVIGEYEAADFMCLYALPTALDFYPRFGFSRLPEYRRVVKNASIPESGLVKRRLELSEPEDFDMLKYFLNNSLPVSRKFSVTGDKSFLMFELVNNKSNTLWYLEYLDAVVAAEEKDGALHINHVMSVKPAAADEVVKFFPSGSPRDIVFGYTPDTLSRYQAEYELVPGPALFVKGGIKPSENFMMPYYFRS